MNDEIEFTIEDDKELEKKIEQTKYSVDVLRSDILNVIDVVSNDVKTRAERKQKLLDKIDEKFTDNENDDLKKELIDKLKQTMEVLEAQGKLKLDDVYSFYKFISSIEEAEKKDLFYYYNILKNEDGTTLEHFANMIAPKGGQNSAVVLAFSNENRKDNVDDLINGLSPETLRAFDNLVKRMDK